MKSEKKKIRKPKENKAEMAWEMIVGWIIVLLLLVIVLLFYTKAGKKIFDYIELIFSW